MPPMTCADTPAMPPARRGQRGPAPTGAERTFGPEEIIVSKTDPRGVITYANDVFIRVAGYAEPDILGQPHNLIRHPDMPRAVFRLMWDVIAAGDELFAYVLNLAADGGHYWVFAHVTPTFDAAGRISGYHSNRRWVPPATRRTVAALYRTVLAAERSASGSKDAVTAGTGALTRALDDAGTDYDTWVWSLAAADELAAVTR